MSKGNEHANRKPRGLTPAEIEWVYSLKESDITAAWLREQFGRFKDRPARFKPEDGFILPKGKLRNPAEVYTTLGRYLYNLFALYPVKYEYYNVPMNSKTFGALNSELVDRVTEDELATEAYVDFLNRSNWLGLNITSFISPSLGVEEITCPPKTEELRKKLLTEHSDAISRGDTKVIEEIEKQLVASAKEELKDADGAPVYGSCGKKPTWDNQYKNMALLRGAVYNPETGGFDGCVGNLSDGTPLDEMPSGANLLLAGAGGRALQTRFGGYISKQLTAAFQGIVLDKPGSDCGSKETLEIEITPQNYRNLKLRYIKEGNKLVLLDRKTLPLYIGKKALLRSPMHCHSAQLCSKCYGELSYKIGILNVGLTYNLVGEILKGLAMKSFHDSTVKTAEIDLNTSVALA